MNNLNSIAFSIQRYNKSLLNNFIFAGFWGFGVGVGVASNSVAVLFAKVMQPELRIIAMNATKTPAMRSNPIILFQLNSITAIATLKTEAGDN